MLRGFSWLPKGVVTFLRTEGTKVLLPVLRGACFGGPGRLTTYKGCAGTPCFLS